MKKLIYKITPKDAWTEAEREGVFRGAAIDHADGYIHFSSAEQVAKTASLYFAEQDDLLLVAVETEKLGDDLKWEKSRGDALFPHLYAELPMTAVLWAKPMPLGADGVHTLPELEA